MDNKTDKTNSIFRPKRSSDPLQCSYKNRSIDKNNNSSTKKIENNKLSRKINNKSINLFYTGDRFSNLLKNKGMSKIKSSSKIEISKAIFSDKNLQLTPDNKKRQLFNDMRYLIKNNSDDKSPKLKTMTKDNIQGFELSQIPNIEISPIQMKNIIRNRNSSQKNLLPKCFIEHNSLSTKSIRTDILENNRKSIVNNSEIFNKVIFAKKINSNGSKINYYPSNKTSKLK